MRSRVVEFIGAPASGKSTIYDALCREWKSDSGWIYPGMLLGRQSLSITRLGEWTSYRVKRLLRMKLHHSTSVNDGLRYIRNHEELTSFYWDLLNNPDCSAGRDISLRFRAVYFLYRDFCQYQAIQDAAPAVPCLIDEGLLQKSFLIDRTLQEVGDLLDDYLPLLQLPCGIIWVNLEDTETLLQRLRNRKKIIATHIGKNDDELLDDLLNWRKVLELIVDKVQSYDIKIVRLNGQDSIKKNIGRIQEFVTNLS